MTNKCYFCRVNLTPENNKYKSKISSVLCAHWFDVCDSCHESKIKKLSQHSRKIKYRA